MKDKLITIIIPVYNVEAYLEECICSAINQSYKNLEIILINDGSSDNSEEICKKYSSEDKRIVFISQKNKGIAETRNIGLEKANGEYILFLDSDDWITYHTIEKLYKLLEENCAQIGVPEKERFYGTIIHKDDENINISIESSDNVLEMLLKRTFSSYMAGILYDSKLIKNIKFPKFSCHEDQAVFYKIIAKAETIVFTSEKMYKYRDNKASITNKINITKCEERFDSLKLLAEGIVTINPKLKNIANEFLYFNYIDIILSFNIKKHNDFYNLLKNEINILDKEINKSNFSKKERIKIFLYKVNEDLARTFFNIYRKLSK